MAMRAKRGVSILIAALPPASSADTAARRAMARPPDSRTAGTPLLCSLYYLAMISASFSAVNPRCFATSAAGPDAPNLSMERMFSRLAMPSQP